ncbi:putative MATE family efflux protein [Natranaerovirga pectinivora]|uniref:Multidrug export protein MepA n=1 Tax=Natranaerovirga pectinivora TaxID=682400 RepID=A0A4R3MLA8_9FIRM|nr:MATE family efflux transporter [Natranaerovirga pectinivora]TCT15408.1 putative MATE family efflux protein [Natranaerovirga pectinivora]
MTKGVNFRQKRSLGEEKISRLLFNLAFPSIFAMTVNALYNIVDTIFIGKWVGDLGIAGLAIAFPIQMLIMGFGQLIGIGAASAISRSLGAGDKERAEKVLGNSFTSLLFLSGIFAIIGLVFTDFILVLFGATETILPYAKDYVTIIFMGSVFFAFAVNLNNIVRAEGKAVIAMFSMVIGAVLNIALDPIFIYFLDMGIKGAALATIISQFVSFLFVMTYILSGKSALKLKLQHLKADFKIMKEIVSVGFSAFAKQSTNSFFAIIVNNTLRVFGGDVAITIFGIVNRIIMFLFLPMIGIVHGMQPIVGYNYGANKIKRVKQTINLTLIVATVFAVIGWINGMVFGGFIVRAFTEDPYLISEGARVFRIVILMLPLVGIQFVGATLFQSLGKAIPALILSMLRQFIVLAPLVIILPRIFGLELLGVWIAFPISDIIASGITIFLITRQLKLIYSQIDEEEGLKPNEEN